MTATKAQELEALKKIQKIVEELGTDSYLSITFEGCFEQAKQNIENDWGNNYKDMCEYANKEWSITRGELEGVKTQLESAKLKNENLKSEIETLNKAIAGERELAENIGNAKAQACDELRASKEEVASLKSEIIELKAKLYDLMTK